MNTAPDGSLVTRAKLRPPESAESVSVAARVATAVEPSATLMDDPVDHDGVWSFRSVTVTAYVIVAPVFTPSLMVTVTSYTLFPPLSPAES